MVLKILGLVYWFHNTKRFEIEIYNIFGNILWNFFSKKPLLFAPIKTVSLIIIYFPESTILKFKKAFFKRKYEKIIWNVDADKLFKDVLTWSYTWHNCNYNFCGIIFFLMTPVLQADMTMRTGLPFRKTFVLISTFYNVKRKPYLHNLDT